MTNPNSSLVGTVQGPVDYAILGAQMTAVGLSQIDIEGFLARMDRTAEKESKTAARNTTLAMVSELLAIAAAAYKAGAMQVYQRLVHNSATGVFGNAVHRQCVDTALTVANEPPRYIGALAAGVAQTHPRP